MVVTLGQQYNVGEKPTVILYTYINRHAGTPDKKQKQNISDVALQIDALFCARLEAYWHPQTQHLFLSPSSCCISARHLALELWRSYSYFDSEPCTHVYCTSRQGPFLFSLWVCIQYYSAVAPVIQWVTSKPYCTDTEVVGSILGEVTRTGIFSHRMPRKLVNKIRLGSRRERKGQPNPSRSLHLNGAFLFLLPPRNWAPTCSYGRFLIFQNVGGWIS